MTDDEVQNMFAHLLEAAQSQATELAALRGLVLAISRQSADSAGLTKAFAEFAASQIAKASMPGQLPGLSEAWQEKSEQLQSALSKLQSWPTLDL